MDEDEEDGEAMQTGEPEPASDEAPTERLWVGSIPSNLVGGESRLASVLNINANQNITSLFSKFGKVKHSTVRVKSGENKSWALISFEDIASAKACHDEGITVLDSKYEEIKLRVSFGASLLRTCNFAPGLREVQNQKRAPPFAASVVAHR